MATSCFQLLAAAKRAAIPVLALLAVSNLAAAAVREVGNGKAYNTIRGALQDAEDGDTIVIHEGHYKEGALTVERTIRITGVGSPVIDGEGKGEIIVVKAPRVTIRGLVFARSGRSAAFDNAAVRFERADSCEVTGNIFIDNFFGVYLAESNDCVIKNNRLRTAEGGEALSGNGIHVWKSARVHITENSIEGHRDGIYFEFVTDSAIDRNLSQRNGRYGLHFMFSDRCTYKSNIFSQNGAGVAVMYTKRVSMVDNVFQENRGPASYGVLFKELTDSTLNGNTFDGNTTAIFFDGSSRIEVRNNNLRLNGHAVRLLGNSGENVFEANTFAGNTFDVSTNRSSAVNRFKGNYWSGYEGYDRYR
jgi:nitrous oxidase accessory protein